MNEYTKRWKIDLSKLTNEQRDSVGTYFHKQVMASGNTGRAYDPTYDILKNLNWLHSQNNDRRHIRDTSLILTSSFSYGPPNTSSEEITFADFQKYILKEKILPTRWKIHLRGLSNYDRRIVGAYFTQQMKLSGRITDTYEDGDFEWLKSHNTNDQSIMEPDETKSVCSFSGNSEDYEEISFEEFKTYILNNIKKIEMQEMIGWKLSKDKYSEAAKKITGVSDWGCSVNDTDFSINSSAESSLCDAGVLDLWFRPVYKRVMPAVGEWVTFTNINQFVTGCSNIGTGTFQVVNDSHTAGLLSNETGFNVRTINGVVWRINGDFRRATSEEIDANSIPKVTIRGYNAEFLDGGQKVKFGCQTYSKAFIKALWETIDKLGFTLHDDHCNEITADVETIYNFITRHD